MSVFLLVLGISAILASSACGYWIYYKRLKSLYPLELKTAKILECIREVSESPEGTLERIDGIIGKIEEEMRDETYVKHYPEHLTLYFVLKAFSRGIPSGENPPPSKEALDLLRNGLRLYINAFERESKIDVNEAISKIAQIVWPYVPK